MESAWPLLVSRGHLAFAASMACLASAVVSGGGVAWQPSAAATSAGTYGMSPHDGSPLGEGEDDTGLPCYRKLVQPGGSEEGQLILLVDSPWNDSV